MAATLALSPFRRIAAKLAERVRSGELLPGQALPPRRELAVTLGVNINTVNRAIEQLVAEKVLQTTERLGTFVALGVVSMQAAPTQKRTVLAGLLVSNSPGEADHGWGPTVQRSLEGALSRLRIANRATRIRCGGAGELATALREALAGGAEALVISWLESQPAWREELLANLPAGFPAVIVSTTMHDLLVPHTCVDDRQDGWRAAEHLLTAGYRRILPVGWFSNPWWTARWDGAGLALANAGLEAPPLPADQQSFEEWSGLPVEQRMHRLDQEVVAIADQLGNGATPSALLCANDPVAAAVCDALMARGLRLGADVGILGWDDSPEADARGLSSIRQPLPDMAEHAARLLNDLIAGRAVPVRSSFTGQLILRQSTRLI